jgi:hypothetical protein
VPVEPPLLVVLVVDPAIVVVVDPAVVVVVSVVDPLPEVMKVTTE